MKALLLTTVSKLGKAGDIVSVADGYFRNVLAKQKLAIAATAQHQQQADARDVAEKKKRADEAARWKELFERLKTLRIILAKKANPQGHLFAKVSPEELAEKLTLALDGMRVDPAWISFDQPIKTLGEHTVGITLPHLSRQSLPVEITAE